MRTYIITGGDAGTTPDSIWMILGIIASITIVIAIAIIILCLILLKKRRLSKRVL